MELSHKGSAKWIVNLRSSELQTLMCAAKWILNGGKGRVPREAKERLRKIVDSYQTECDQLSRSCKKTEMLSLKN